MRGALVLSLENFKTPLRTRAGIPPPHRSVHVRLRALSVTMQDSGDRDLLRAISDGGPAAWQAFLDACADTIFRVVRLFADSYDDRMDFFLFACAKLKEDDMRRPRTFRFRPEAPCRYSTWLSVVVKNLAMDFIREKDGRFRPFRNVEAMDGVDRLVFDYHLRDGLPLPEVRARLRARHGIHLEEGALSDLAGRVQERLSASQRWRLLARLSEKRRTITIDPVAGSAGGAHDPIPLADTYGDPERPLRSLEAARALHAALDELPPRQRLALTLRFRDGLSAREVAALLRVEPGEAERLAHQGVATLRERLTRSGFTPPDFETAGLATMWPC